MSLEARVLILSKIADALFAPLPEEEEASRKEGDSLSAELLATSGGALEVALKAITIIEKQFTPTARKQLYLLFRLLNTRLGTFALVGRRCVSSFGVPQAFVSLPRNKREAVLLAWAQSSCKHLRLAFKAAKSTSMSALFTHLTPEGTSPLLAALRYSIVDPARPPLPAPSALTAEATIAAALVDLSAADGSAGGVSSTAAALTAKGMETRFPEQVSVAAVRKVHPQLVLKADVVVVGSGAGGGVAAARLAAAGLRVVVLEKAGFVRAAEMSLQEAQSFEARPCQNRPTDSILQTMYERGGFLASEDGSVSILAGSTLGGGTRINWCASFRTPPHVRHEWAEGLGLHGFSSPNFDASLDAVCDRLGVRTGFMHPPQPQALRDGLQALGVHEADVPRNCSEPDCGGHCCFGCARGHKQDTVNTWLADACHAGARILTGVYAERVITDSNAGAQQQADTLKRRPKRAVGVLCTAGHPSAPLRFVVQAPVVVSSCGSVHTPALLLRSGIKCGGNVGRNLRLHPCTCLVGIFPSKTTMGTATRTAATCTAPAPVTGAKGGQTHCAQQQQLDMPGGACRPGSIRCSEGTIMSIYSKEAANWDGDGYGAVLYTPAVHPGLFAATCPWLGTHDYKKLMLQYPNAAVVLVLTRDQDPGRVVIDGDGRPRIHYTLSKRDEASMRKGTELGLRSLAAAGADTVLTLQSSFAGRFTFATSAASTASRASQQHTDAHRGDLPGPVPKHGSPGMVAARGGNPGFEQYLAGVGRHGFQNILCAHQMGSARLGVDPGTSALDPQGECWDAAGLFCLDGSVLPTSLGVNPMVTIEAISHMLAGDLAERVVAELKRQGKWKRRATAVQLDYERASPQAKL